MKAFAVGIVLLAMACRRKPDVVAPPDAGIRLIRLDPAASKRLGIVVSPVGTRSASAHIDLPGTLEYDLERYAEIGALQEGRVTSVSARVGERVKIDAGLLTMLVPSIAQAQAQYLQARAEVDAARARAERENGLLAKQLTTAQEAETAEAAALSTNAGLQASRARLEVMGAAPPRATKTIEPGIVTLRTPIAGVVVRRDAVLGQFARQGQTLFVVADPETLWATFDAFASDLPYLRVGTAVTIAVDGIPGKVLDGKVALMEPQLESGSRALRARVAVANPGGTMRPGMFLRVSIPLPEPNGDGGLLVPSAAVQPLGDDDVVFVEREPGVFEVRLVQVGHRTPQLVEVDSGLRRGEPIAVAGTFLLRAEATRQ